MSQFTSLSQNGYRSVGKSPILMNSKFHLSVLTRSCRYYLPLPQISPQLSHRNTCSENDVTSLCGDHTSRKGAADKVTEQVEDFLSSNQTPLHLSSWFLEASCVGLSARASISFCVHICWCLNEANRMNIACSPKITPEFHSIPR